MSLHDRIESWRERREREREIAGVTPAEIADYGLTRQEFLDLALMPSEQIARMEAMARLNGVEPARLEEDRTLHLAVALTCARCGENRRCRQALRDGAGAEETGFCPNHGTYEALAAE